MNDDLREAAITFATVTAPPLLLVLMLGFSPGVAVVTGVVLGGLATALEGLVVWVHRRRAD